MAQEAMAFRGFVWPSNPYTITYAAAQEQSVALYPGGASKAEPVARRPRIVKGEGLFYGPQAQGQMNRLEQIFMEQKAGLLFLPGRRAMHAWFTELSVLEQVKPGTVAYSFLFTEAAVNRREEDHAYSGYTYAAAGENLFHVAARTEVPVERLSVLNSLAGCFTLKEGDLLRLK